MISQTHAGRRMFLMEFNELCPHLLDRFMSEGYLPNFQRLYRDSTIMTTDAQETPPNLEPWIQWVTLHSGLTFAEHGAFDLGDGKRLQHKLVGELLSDAGIRVGICCSMNMNYRRLNGYVIPDPWDPEGKTYPDDLSPFYEIVSRQVQESSKNESLSKQEMLRFGLFMARQGLKPSTVKVILRQLWSERKNKGLSWRRAMLLDRLQYDFFRHLNKRYEIQFGTLFLNSTAHFQHYFWRNMEPEIFETPPSSEDDPSLRDAILDGYRAMDVIVGQFLRDYPDEILVLCTALSQQPWTDTQKCTFRPRSFDEFLKWIGVSPLEVTIKPVMAEEFHIYCQSPDVAQRVHRLIGELRMNNLPVMKVRQDGTDLFAGCRITDGALKDGVVARGDGQTKAFQELFHMVHSVRSGRHHPHGILWLRNGQHTVHKELLPLTHVAPMILNHFGVPLPEHMRAHNHALNV